MIPHTSAGIPKMDLKMDDCYRIIQRGDKFCARVKRWYGWIEIDCDGDESIFSTILPGISYWGDTYEYEMECIRKHVKKRIKTIHLVSMDDIERKQLE